MIGIFIPSYNRPMQLLALLESIFKFDNYNLLRNIHVRYQGSTELHQKAYQKLLELPICEYIDIKSKKGLSDDMLEVMTNPRYKYFNVITDDSIFYRKINISYEDIDDFLTDEVNHLGFRLGKNTTQIDYCNPDLHDSLNHTIVGPLLKFKWTQHGNHYGHAAAIDGSLFNREWILQKTLESCGLGFDYRAWECKVNDIMKIWPVKPYALCPINSVLVNVPANQVTDGQQVKNGINHPYTINELSQKFIDGFKIDLDAIAKNKIVSVQQEIPFEFIKND